MAAAALRHYSLSITSSFAMQIVPAVATSRALVVGKIIIAASAASTITITVGGKDVVTALALTAGQVYTETGLVVLATETITVTAGTVSVLTAHVFGEEVDN